MSNIDETTMKQKGDWIESAISDLLGEDDSLNHKTLAFVESIAHQFGERGWLFPAQAKALESIWSNQFGFARNR